MHLVMDIRNAQVHSGVYDDEGNRLCSWRMKTDTRQTADMYGMWIGQQLHSFGIEPEQLEGALLCSVVPEVEGALEDAVSDHLHLPVLFVGPGIRTGINILYDNPREVGADRITNALAGREQFGSPLIIVDFETAITYGYVNEQGQFAGGAITPGMDLAMEALSTKASRLPRIDPRRSEPDVIGRSTAEALHAGWRYGIISQVEGMIHRIRRRSGSQVKAVASGEHADWMTREIPQLEEAAPFLTLDGLHLLFEKNRTAFPS
ncbi:type III pantothenate kinase [Alkalicoccus chagannorensis]|uniref:type III pantothenate kinase n=1 Tax=Alkalicoccus chagannorensis TaxID=427072 RepID=UPI000420D76C|nr:type III pantothenate kinase [Alkalicoccus chagannorensis]